MIMQPRGEDPDRLEILTSIPADRTTGHETAEKRPDYVDETEHAGNN